MFGVMFGGYVDYKMGFLHPFLARFRTMTVVLKGKEVEVALVGRRGTKRIGEEEESKELCASWICTHNDVSQ